MAMRISDMIISMLIVGLFVTVIVAMSSDMTSKYATADVSSQLAAYNNSLAPLNANVKEIQNKQDNVSSSSKLDVIGDFFNQGYSALKITGNSFAVMDNVSSKALQDAQLGPMTDVFRNYIIIIITVVIFIAILLTVLVRADI